MTSYSRDIIHEGEYIPKPSRPSLPISSTSSPDPIGYRSSSYTPVRLNPPNLTVADLSINDEFEVPPYTKEDKNDPNDPNDSGNDSADSHDSSLAESIVPKLVHKWSHTHSILCVIPAPKKKLLFCGTQDSKILVFDMVDYTLKFEAAASPHDNHSSILCLDITEDENFLFSAGSDSLVKIWDLSKLKDIPDSANLSHLTCSHVIYSVVDIGDIFSIAWSDTLATLFIGAQNAAILWCRLPLRPSHTSCQSSPLSTIERLPHFRYDKFFDSKGPGGSVNTLQTKYQLHRKNSSNAHPDHLRPKLVEVRNEDIIRFAHNGYVYCMSLHTPQLTDDIQLISCGGDGIINVWSISLKNSNVQVSKVVSLENDDSILSMSIQDYLYVGLSDSSINVWDLTTYQMIRSFHFCDTSTAYDEVLSLGIYRDCVFKATNLGGLVKFTIKNQPAPVTEEDTGNNKHPVYKSFKVLVSAQDDKVGHSFSNRDETGAVLAVNIFTDSSGITYLLSGGHKALCLWEISNPHRMDDNQEESALLAKPADHLSNEHLLSSLEKFTSYKTISKFPTQYLEHSRQCAQFLSRLLNSLGASHTELLPVVNGNPIVYSVFSRNSPGQSTKPTRVLWYAHYDVVDATDSEATDWATDPFVLTAKDGSLYARGVSDNKGPTLAAIYAVAELYHKQQLSSDVVFIIEGEEECGSIGFQNVITKNKALIGDIDWVMLSNSYWLDDETPCLNYGLRGVINASVTIKSSKPDRHSGVDGGVSKEPTMDMIHILGQLVDSETDEIKLSNFYDDVLPLTKTEIELYKNIEKAALDKNINNQDLQTLMAKWRNPSLTIHKIQVSGPNNNTVIPQIVKATISIRIVPNQNLFKIKQSLVEFLEAKFAKLNSDNKLSVNIFHEAEPWLGDPTNHVYKVLHEKTKANWGQVEPLFIREGGSIPSIRFLEKCFDAPAAQIPCGQASDNAHLKDEKLRIVNLYKLRAILTDTLRELGLKNNN